MIGEARAATAILSRGSFSKMSVCTTDASAAFSMVTSLCLNLLGVVALSGDLR